jgi:hypothetical protein
MVCCNTETEHVGSWIWGSHNGYEKYWFLATYSPGPPTWSIQTLPLSSLLISHVAPSPSHPSFYIAECFRLVTESASTCSRWFVSSGFFYPEDGGDIPPKRRFTDLHYVTAQKTVFFIVTDVKASNPTWYRIFNHVSRELTASIFQLENMVSSARVQELKQ